MTEEKNQPKITIAPKAGLYKYERDQLQSRLKSLARDYRHAKEILQESDEELNWIIEHLTKKTEKDWKKRTKVLR